MRGGAPGRTIPDGGIVDVHAHAFPDALAARAVPHLAEKADVRPFLDGTVASLLGSMDAAGIAVSVVCSIATEPRQFDSILEWSRGIASDRILPFPSLHPRSPQVGEEIARIAAAGFAGVKLHPEYQDFFIDDEALAPLYEGLEAAGLVLLFHAGADIGFPDSDRSDPRRILQVHRDFPALRVIASHLGGFRRWEQTAETLLGEDVYLDTSYTFGHIPRELLLAILTGHREDRIVFGSDSPWTGQGESIAATRALPLEPALVERILRKNATELLFHT